MTERTNTNTSAKSSGSNNKQSFHDRSIMKPRGEVIVEQPNDNIWNRNKYLIVNSIDLDIFINYFRYL